MAATLTIPTIFTAVDKFTATVDRMSRSVSGFSKKAELSLAKGNRLFSQLTPTLSSASKQLFSFASAAAIAGAAVASVAFGGKSIMDYEVALHSLQAVTGASYKLFQGQIESIANRTKKSAIDVAGSFEVIGSAMSQYLQDPKSLGLIAEAGITLSKASRQELIPTLENLTGIMNQFKLEAKDAYAVINRLTAGEIVGNMRTAEVATALQEFGAGAKLANVNLGESVALVEVLGRQMSHAQVGNAAKNIMIILDSAKGLQKRARKELTAGGVNMDLLMSHTAPLGVKLKELSKILHNSVAMTKVFGRENKTAGQVILSNLDTYNEWEKQIQTTNAAQKQAADNSATLAAAWDRLKNSFVNAVVSGGKTNKGLATITKYVDWLGDHMETVLSVGLKIIGFFAAWKLLLWTGRIALAAYNIVLALNAGLSTTAAAATVTQTVAVGGFGTAIAGVTTELSVANVAATGFFATLSSFVVPAALVALGGLALWKVLNHPHWQDGDMADFDPTKISHFDKNKPSTFKDSFFNPKEEDAYQKWFTQRFKGEASLDTLQRNNFDKIHGSEFKQFGNLFDPELLKPKAATIPVLNRPSAEAGGSGAAAKDSTVHIFLHDTTGAVKNITSTGGISVKVTSTQGAH